MSSTLTCEIASEHVYEEWDAFAQGPRGHLAQTTWWARPMGPLGMTFDVVTCRSGGELAGGALIRWAQPKLLPFSRGTCLGGPIFSEWSPSMASPFLDAVRAAAKRRRSVEVVFIDAPDNAIQGDLVAELTRRKARIGVRPSHSHAIIDLKDRTIDEVTKSMKDRAKYSIKRGRRSLRFQSVTDDPSLAAAYRTFEATADRKDFSLRPSFAGLPMIREAIDRNVGAVIGALDSNGDIVAAAFIVFIGEEAFYEYGGYLDSASELYPNHALQAEAIAMTIARGFSGYDMGSLSVKKEDAGVNDFKLGFGAEPRPRSPRLQWATMRTMGRIMDQVSDSRRGNDILRAIRRSIASHAKAG